MAKLTFIETDGSRHALEADNGFSVMEVAVRNGLTGIEADCGGACACATCHVYVDPTWMEAAGSAGADEAEMLDFAVDRRETSRLSCQIRVTDALDGLVVHIPESQH